MRASERAMLMQKGGRELGIMYSVVMQHEVSFTMPPVHSAVSRFVSKL